jgi:hypothetical protein
MSAWVGVGGLETRTQDSIGLEIGLEVVPYVHAREHGSRVEAQNPFHQTGELNSASLI